MQFFAFIFNQIDTLRETAKQVGALPGRGAAQTGVKIASHLG
jgi:hypothetical protein